ncbi:F-box/LRR-repeat protein 20-like [Chaetodon trifascialis]|uniref:F-box/LRR-repeat protein 20-like n=1 Tax=Chaetodon trifascialis TaxID=109706 RepID=UPI0039913550
MCPGLQHLNIGQVPKVNAHSLTVMMSQLKRLISLNLTGLQAVTDATVDTLLQNCVELQSLTFSSCPGVTDLTLHSIGKYTPCIRSLDVSGCKAVTDAGVQALALGCRGLQQLDLSSTGTGNRGVTLLANYCSRHLQTIKLSFCHITLENILKLCRCCKRLKVLHLYGCSQIPAERDIRQVNRAPSPLGRNRQDIQAPRH